MSCATWKLTKEEEREREREETCILDNNLDFMLINEECILQ